jgi:hypothetical protein
MPEKPQSYKSQKYQPERNYIERGFEPYDMPFEDLCGSCDVYYDLLHRSGKTTKEFPVQCKRHILDSFKGITIEDLGLTEEEFNEFLISSDPVTWAMHNFGWKARWYQEELMSCTAQRKVVRAGRRVGKTLAVVIIAAHMMATRKNCSILIIAPFEVQVAKIFDEMIQLFDSSPDLASSVKRNTRNPCRFELNNGSKAIGFSSGANAGSGSDKIRGQDADYIIIDEADYINQKDIEAILAILASHPETGLWASSTPKGTHDKFYQFCVQKDLGFKEFWYISQEAPNWTLEVEEFFKLNFDKTSYEHEFLAVFGVQESGVFRNDLIDNALMEYQLPRERTEGSWVIIGVDWNGQSIGTHIMVCEAIIHNSAIKYVVLDKLVIKGSEFAAHTAVATIADLNEKYDPKFIYVDAGYGEVQIEMLRKIGKENTDTGLHKKIVSYTMQGTIEINDPTMFMEPIKKPAKPFMVNWAVQQLEQGRIILPTSEDTQILADTTETEEKKQHSGLVQQMRNFSIEAVSSLGAPRYSQGEEHTLTAWMLCIVGFGLELSDLRKRVNYIPPQSVGFIGQTVEASAEEVNKRLSAVSRQLDKGTPNSMENKGLSSIVMSTKGGKNLEKKISSGDRKTISQYFKNKGDGRALGKPTSPRPKGTPGNRTTF